MLKVKEAIVVEGRYDKNTLSQLVDAVILETSGFGVFKNRELVELLRQLASRRGLIVLTDSDGGGFVIRNYLKGVIDPRLVKHAYIPDVLGKERRKRAPGKEGKLGVEGMSPAVLEKALRRAGATILNEEGTGPGAVRETITKADLMVWGLSGGEGSREHRSRLLRALCLPEYLSPNALLPVLNALWSREELEESLDQLGIFKKDEKSD